MPDFETFHSMAGQAMFGESAAELAGLGSGDGSFFSRDSSSHAGDRGECTDVTG